MKKNWTKMLLLSGGTKARLCDGNCVGKPKGVLFATKENKEK